VVFYRYSPENMPEHILEKLFVGRGKVFWGMSKDLEEAATRKTPRHYLVVGPRGIGKSQ